MKSEIVVDVVRKLIGPISPVGETNADERRYENIIELIDVLDALLLDVVDASEHRFDTENSRKRIGQYADDWLQDWREVE